MVGDGLASVTQVSLRRYDASGGLGAPVSVAIKDQTASGIVAKLPAGVPFGVYSLTATDPSNGTSNATLINAPRVQWIDSSEAMPNGSLRLVGRNLKPTTAVPTVRFVDASGRVAAGHRHRVGRLRRDRPRSEQRRRGPHLPRPAQLQRRGRRFRDRRQGDLRGPRPGRRPLRLGRGLGRRLRAHREPGLQHQDRSPPPASRGGQRQGGRRPRPPGGDGRGLLARRGHDLPARRELPHRQRHDGQAPGSRRAQGRRRGPDVPRRGLPLHGALGAERPRRPGVPDREEHGHHGPLIPEPQREPIPEQRHVRRQHRLHHEPLVPEERGVPDQQRGGPLDRPHPGGRGPELPLHQHLHQGGSPHAAQRALPALRRQHGRLPGGPHLALHGFAQHHREQHRPDRQHLPGARLGGDRRTRALPRAGRSRDQEHGRGIWCQPRRRARSTAR